MERISPETKAIYELLHADFDQALDKSHRDHIDSTAQAISKLDAKLDQLSGSIDDVKLSLGVDIDDVKLSLGVDIDELRHGLD